MGALPLRNHPRVWGRLSSFELPVQWLRPPYSVWLYALVFGCDLNEIEPSGLTKYASLGNFFYQKLKPGALQVSLADGTVVNSGTINILGVKQVKGITHSLHALLGVESHIVTNIDNHGIFAGTRVGRSSRVRYRRRIEYGLDKLLGFMTSNTPGSMPAIEQMASDSDDDEEIPHQHDKMTLWQHEKQSPVNQ